MGASVRIEDEAFSDDRYEDLAHLAGLADADHARGKMARLWRQCTIEQRRVLPVATVARVLGENGVRALIESRLGEKTRDGIRIRGTKGRIEWLKKLRDNGKFGKLGGRPKTNPQGLPEKPTRVPKDKPEETPPAPSPAPSPTNKKSRPAAPPPVSGFQETIADFHGRYESAYGSKPTWSVKEAAQIKRLLTSHGETEVRKRIAFLFESPPSWLSGPFDVGTLVSQFNKLVAAKPDPRNELRANLQPL